MDFKDGLLPISDLQLHVDELGYAGHTHVFTLPLFTEEICSKLVDRAKASDKWKAATTYNSVEAGTAAANVLTDSNSLYLRDLDNELSHQYTNILRSHICPIASKLFNLPDVGPYEPGNITNETFISKYDCNNQADCAFHHDTSAYTLIVSLNSDYEGGGTYFKNQRILSKPDVGHATLHPGNITHYHGGRITTKGTRYILVSFLSIKQ